VKLPKIDVQARKLAELLNEMEIGTLQVPRFQREFVWPLTKTRALLDSMYKEFPIGSFFVWRAPADSAPLSRPLAELGIPAPQPGFPVAYILDGQQRLASLYAVIKGLRVGYKDYGHICIDLAVATRYEQNRDEGFEENIFVYRTGDNERFIPVQDLVGENHLTIFATIRQDWQPAFNKAHNLFQTYPFSVVWVQEQTLADAIVIFQRINQAGQRLSRYDLVCANVWTKDFDFRWHVAGVNRDFARQGFGELHETIFTQTFALILGDQCTTVAELSLDSEEIQRVWDRAIQALALAVDFAANNLGVKRAEYLPYRGLLVVLAYYFYHAGSPISAQERDVLWKWFWRVTLSERYSSTSPSRVAEDARKLRALIDGQEVTFSYPSTVTAESVRRSRMTSTNSALRNAVICLLALKQPRNLKDGSPVNLSDSFFSDLKKTERHHIFPIGYMRAQHLPVRQVHLIPNFCFIPSDLNKEIGSRSPAEYLTQYRDDNPGFAAAAESHLLSVDSGAPVWTNDFDAFMTERAQRIADELNRLAESTPANLLSVDVLEVHLRDVIDRRLTAVLGPHYWKQSAPGDVTARVTELITDWTSRHPYADQARFALGRTRLDFCDVSDYDKIILRNWTQFGDLFQRKDEFQRHMTAYRTLRNCVQHNRKSSDIEQKNGEAAMLWLKRILDQCDRTVAAVIEIDGDELETQGPEL